MLWNVDLVAATLFAKKLYEDLANKLRCHSERALF
jgi:hypothetical protein